MSSSLIQIINNAARPFKPFEVKIGEQDFTFKTRVMSATESDELNRAFGEKFDEVSQQMEAGNIDLAMIRRGLAKQSVEGLAKLVVKADRMDYLSEASLELDDKPFSDPQVIALADEKQETALKLLLGATEEEVLEQALERRAFVVAMLRATDYQNLYFLYLSLYKADETPAFDNAEEVGQLDRPTISLLINKIHEVIRGRNNVDPLKPRAKKQSKKPTPSVKTSEEESKVSSTP